MKRVVLSLLTTIMLMQNVYSLEKQKPLSITMVDEVASVTNDIAELIINSKTNKDAQITKNIVVRLITHLATIANAVIEHKKTKRSFSFQQDTNSSIDHKTIEELANIVIQKVEEKEEL